MGVHQEKSVLHDELHTEKNVEHLKQLSQLLKREMEHFVILKQLTLIKILIDFRCTCSSLCSENHDSSKKMN